MRKQQLRCSKNYQPDCDHHMNRMPFLPHHDGSSFFDFLTQHHPELRPGVHDLAMPRATLPLDLGRPGAIPVPHGTTVLALKYRDGAIIAGDRRATEGFRLPTGGLKKCSASMSIPPWLLPVRPALY